MKLIKLTSTAKNDKYPAIYINVEQIGSIYQLYKEEYGVGKLETRVGVTTTITEASRLRKHLSKL